MVRRIVAIAMACCGLIVSVSLPLILYIHSLENETATLGLIVLVFGSMGFTAMDLRSSSLEYEHERKKWPKLIRATTLRRTAARRLLGALLIGVPVAVVTFAVSGHRELGGALGGCGVFAFGGVYIMLHWTLRPQSFLSDSFLSLQSHPSRAWSAPVLEPQKLPTPWLAKVQSFLRLAADPQLTHDVWVRGLSTVPDDDAHCYGDLHHALLSELDLEGHVYSCEMSQADRILFLELIGAFSVIDALVENDPKAEESARLLQTPEWKDLRTAAARLLTQGAVFRAQRR